MILSSDEKKILLCILNVIINADGIISDNEVRYYNWVRESYDISDDVFMASKSFNPHEAVSQLRSMSDQKKALFCKIIYTMGKIDGHPLEDTVEAIEHVVVKARLLDAYKQYPNPE